MDKYLGNGVYLLDGQKVEERAVDSFLTDRGFSKDEAIAYLRLLWSERKG